MLIDNNSRKAVLQLCYAAFSKTAPEYGIHDPFNIGAFGEAMAGKIETFLREYPHNGVMEFSADDRNTYGLFCAALDELQLTLPFINRFNVTLTLRRISLEELKHDPTVIDSHQAGGPTGLVS